MKVLIVALLLLISIASATYQLPATQVNGVLDLTTHQIKGAVNIDANATKVTNSLAWLALNKTRIDTADTWIGTNATKVNNALSWIALNKTRIDTTNTYLGTNATKANNALSWIALNKTQAELTRTWLGTNATKVTNLQANRPKIAVFAGKAPANFTLTGAVVGDYLGGVLYVAKSVTLTSVADITSEFVGAGKGIIANDVLNQSVSGTDTTGGYVIVSWEDVGGI